MELNQSLKNGDETERKRESALTNLSGNSTTLKRQRRPSVRFGDISDQQHCDTNPRKDSNLAGKCSKSKALINNNSISKSGFDDDFRKTLDDDDANKEKGIFDGAAGAVIGSWYGKDLKLKPNPKPKRVKTIWGLFNNDDGDDGDGDNGDDFSRDFDLRSSESPVKLQSPNNDRNAKQIMGSENRDQQDAGGVWKCGKSGDGNVSNGQEKRRSDDHHHLDDDVRFWLNALGLARYAPVFKIHEVDYEVLPLLTMEDLKEMGVNSVGSRRKMYCSIEKFRLGSS